MKYLNFFTIGQFILISCILVMLFLLYRTNKAITLEKRILRFSKHSIDEKSESFFDRLSAKYKNLLSKISNTLNKSNLLKKYSNFFEIYVDEKSSFKTSSMDIISNKFVIATITLLITMLSATLRITRLNVFKVIVSFLIGFFILDIILLITKKRKEKKIEEDFFKAVIIMSNAFKSGRSIIQAIEIVSKELDGVISNEFEKMYIDLTYGLELEVVLDRFCRRINLEESRYMASSLVIINKTGGDIVKVFSSIEKSFISKKRLDDELKSVTSLSNFVYRILTAIPFIIFIVIFFLNPSYFTPLASTIIGKIILAIIFIIYISYILLIKKIMQVKD